MIMSQGRVEYGVIVKDEADVKYEAAEPRRPPGGDRRPPPGLVSASRRVMGPTSGAVVADGGK
jgi:hypothetical protein